MLKIKNQYVKPIPEAPKKKLKRNQPSFKFGIVVGMLIASIIITAGIYFVDNYTIQSPITIKVQPPIVPRQDRTVINSNARKVVKPTVMPIKKKRAEIGKVYASEKWVTIYDYELLKLDANQDAIRLLIEQRLGKAGAQLVFNESGFHPESTNSSSGACGLFQAYPCSKMNCKLSDIECQIEWGSNYIKNRYGTPEKALEFWNANHWY